MKRHNSTERIGISKVALCFEEHYGWIFREQPVADVGIDGIVEIAEEGIPKGEFFAVQVKSGVGNFTKTKLGWTYYISNVHYYYWINLNIPIIIAGYLKGKDIIIWNVITPENIQKTKSKWKICLSGNLVKEKNKSKNVYNSIFKDKANSKKDSKLKSYESLAKLSGREQFNSINDSLRLFGEYQKILTDRLKLEKPKLLIFNRIPKLAIHKDILRANQISILETFAWRIDNESELFAIANSKFLLATLDVISTFIENPDKIKIHFPKGIEETNNLIVMYDLTSVSLESISIGLDSYEMNDKLGMKNTINIARGSIRSMIDEFIIAKGLFIEMRTVLQETLDKNEKNEGKS